MVARDLLGATITTVNSDGLCSGMIVELEAYAQDDEASHAFGNRTERNRIMFAEAGLCYVYVSYGMHYCVNVVTQPEGIGSAVLIRAVAPIEGIELMKKRRGTDQIKNLTSGPGKVCQAMAITKDHYGHDFLSSTEIFLSPGKRVPDERVSHSPRIGISKATHLNWRLFVNDSEFVSKGLKTAEKKPGQPRLTLKQGGRLSDLHRKRSATDTPKPRLVKR